MVVVIFLAFGIEFALAAKKCCWQKSFSWSAPQLSKCEKAGQNCTGIDYSLPETCKQTATGHYNCSITQGRVYFRLFSGTCNSKKVCILDSIPEDYGPVQPDEPQDTARLENPGCTSSP